MKATGMVRRIDDLGRIVIPKEIRKTLKIKEGMPIEIFIDANETIILKKVKPLSDYVAIVEEYICCVANQLGISLYVTDREKLLAVSDKAKKEMSGRKISEGLERILDDRDGMLHNSHKKKAIPILAEGELEEKALPYGQSLAVIRHDGEILGAVLLEEKEDKVRTVTNHLNDKKMEEFYQKILNICADFFATQVNL